MGDLIKCLTEVQDDGVLRLFLSMHLARLFTVVISCVSQERRFRNPNWESVRTLLASKWDIIIITVNYAFQCLEKN